MSGGVEEPPQSIGRHPDTPPTNGPELVPSGVAQVYSPVKSSASGIEGSDEGPDETSWTIGSGTPQADETSLNTGSCTPRDTETAAANGDDRSTNSSASHLSELARELKNILRSLQHGEQKNRNQKQVGAFQAFKKTNFIAIPLGYCSAEGSEAHYLGGVSVHPSDR